MCVSSNSVCIEVCLVSEYGTEPMYAMSMDVSSTIRKSIHRLYEGTRSEWLLYIMYIYLPVKRSSKGEADVHAYYLRVANSEYVSQGHPQSI